MGFRETCPISTTGLVAGLPGGGCLLCALQVVRLDRLMTYESVPPFLSTTASTGREAFPIFQASGYQDTSEFTNVFPGHLRQESALSEIRGFHLGTNSQCHEQSSLLTSLPSIAEGRPCQVLHMVPRFFRVPLSLSVSFPSVPLTCKPKTDACQGRAMKYQKVYLEMNAQNCGSSFVQVIAAYPNEPLDI